mgnify:CR=1 FL=1
MSHTSFRPYEIPSVLSIVMLSMAVAACAGGDFASKDTGENSAAKQQLDAQTMGQQAQAKPVCCKRSRWRVLKYWTWKI